VRAVEATRRAAAEEAAKLKSQISKYQAVAAAAEKDRQAAAAAVAAAAATMTSPSSHLATPVRAPTPRAAAVTPLPAVSAQTGLRASAVTEFSDDEDAATASSGTPAGLSSKAASGATTPAAATAAGGLFSRGRSALRSLSAKATTAATQRTPATPGGGGALLLDDVSAMVPSFVAQQVATAHGIYGPALDVGGFMAALGYAEFAGPTPRGAVRAVFEDALHATRPGASPLWSAWDAQLAAAAHARLAEWRDSSSPMTPRSATAAQTAS
jgi:hypothetical protein